MLTLSKLLESCGPICSVCLMADDETDPHLLFTDYPDNDRQPISHSVGMAHLRDDAVSALFCDHLTDETRYAYLCVHDHFHDLTREGFFLRYHLLRKGETWPGIVSDSLPFDIPDLLYRVSKLLGLDDA